jgi:hypothetical protein
MAFKLKSSGSYYATFDDTSLTADRIYTLPNIDGSLSGTSGTSGQTGTSGTSGQTGTSGTSGQTGTSGTSGQTGTSGSSGTSPSSGAYPTKVAFKDTNQITSTTAGVFSYDNALTITITTAGYYTFDIYLAITSTANVYLYLNGSIYGYARPSGMTSAGYDLTTGTSIGYLTSTETSFTKISGWSYFQADAIFKLGYYKDGGGTINCRAGSFMQIVNVG